MTKKKVTIAVLLLAIGGFAIWKMWPKSKSVTFTTQTVTTDTLKTSVTATGSLAPVDKVEVGTQVSGEVKKIYVDFNTQVKKGQLLAELDKSTLQERLNQCNASLQSATSAYTLALQNYNRTKGLYEQKAATKSDLETVENSLTQAKAQVSQAQTNVREAQVNLKYTQIYAPIDGVVLDRAVEEGQTVASSFNTPTLFTIARDLKKMQVEANIDEADIGYVKKGQQVTFTVSSFNGETFYGTVSQIRMNPITTNNVVTYTVIVSAQNPEEKLLPGMTASISIVTQKCGGMIIPAAATSWSPSEEVMQSLPRPKDRPEAGAPEGMPEGMPEGKPEANTTSQSKNTKTVWIKKGNSIRPQKVEVGMNDGVNYIAVSGVNVGDSIITNATIGEKEKGGKSGGFSLMPKGPGRESKNSAKQGQGQAPRP